MSDNEELFDNMTGPELLINGLAEEAAMKRSNQMQAIGLEENEEAAVEGGQFGRKVREDFEEITGSKVVVPYNNLTSPKNELQSPEEEE